MSIVEMKAAIPQLSPNEAADLASVCIQKLSSEQKVALMQRCTALLSEYLGEHKKPIERLLRRLEHPDVPEDFWAGMEDIEDGRIVDMEVAMNEVPPHLR